MTVDGYDAFSLGYISDGGLVTISVLELKTDDAPAIADEYCSETIASTPHFKPKTITNGTYDGYIVY